MEKWKAFFSVLMILLLLPVLSCGKAPAARGNTTEQQYYATEEEYGGMGFDSEAPAAGTSSGDADQTNIRSNTLLSLNQSDVDQPVMDNSSVPDQEKPNDGEERKRIYSGNASLVVEDVEETKKEVEKLADSIGGYVESVYGNSIVIRVPVDQFEETFQMILDMGRVTYQSIETADVTEAYNDLLGRLDIAETSRTRLYELLARTSDTNEQVQILKEIGRLTEEIESIRLLLQSLDNFTAYSRISLTLEPRLSSDYTAKQNIPFPWIRNLSPLYAASSTLHAVVTLDPGDDFAVFSKDAIYRAENSDGVQIRISSVRNRPVGDGVFWQKALLFHLEDFYESGEEKQIPFGDETVYGVLWTSKDREPFQYFVGVVEDGRFLHVIEIFSPEVNDEAIDSLFEAMGEGGLN